MSNYIDKNQTNVPTIIKNVLQYDTSAIDDDTLYNIVEEDFNSFLDKEIKLLKEKNIKILKVSYENRFIIIEKKIPEDIFKNIPYQLLIIDNEKKTENIQTHNLRIKVILNYFRENFISFYEIKDNGIAFSCPLCGKLNNKCFIFTNNLGIFTMSKTDCDNREHYDYWEKMKAEIEDLLFESENLDKKNIKWNSENVNVTYKNEDDEKIICNLKEFWLRFKHTEQPKIIKKQIIMCLENTRALLKHYRIDIKLNLMNKKIDTFQNNKLMPEGIDYYITYIRNKFKIRNLKILKQDIKDELLFISLENKYNPVKDYLSANYNSEGNYLYNCKKEFEKLVSCINTTTQRVAFKLQKFMIQMCYLACRDEDEIEENPVKAQYILLLHGKQYSGKSTFLQNLLPKHLRQELYRECRSLNVDSRDKIFETVTCWETELAEIEATFKKSDQNAFKQFVTQSIDLIRLPFGSEWLNFKRRVCFTGSTNDNEYLRDSTGTRRFLCFNDVSINRLKINTVDIDKIWCYIYDRYLVEERYEFSDNDLIEIYAENAKHTCKSDKLLTLESYFDLNNPDADFVQISELWEYIQKVSFEDSIIFGGIISFGKFLRQHCDYQKKGRTFVYKVKIL
jgi:predicted P-loop ATPase